MKNSQYTSFVIRKPFIGNEIIPVLYQCHQILQIRSYLILAIIAYFHSIYEIRVTLLEVHLVKD